MSINTIISKVTLMQRCLKWVYVRITREYEQMCQRLRQRGLGLASLICVFGASIGVGMSELLGKFVIINDFECGFLHVFLPLQAQRSIFLMTHNQA